MGKVLLEMSVAVDGYGYDAGPDLPTGSRTARTRDPVVVLTDALCHGRRM
jgi:hypothetical protein